MGKYHGAVITTAGQNVISQAIAGTALTWTVMRTSSTAIPAATDLETLTSLSGIEQTSNITDATIYGDNVLQVSARFSNTGISTAYYIQAVGIYGQLSGGSETLIAVMTAITPDEMPIYDPDAPSAFIFNTQITIQNAQSIVMNVNDTGTATVADLNRKVDIQSGNVSNTVVTTVTTSSASYPSIAAGDTVAVAAGKVNKNLADLGSNKLDKTGDAADAKIGSSTASTASYPVPAANDTFKVILGKIIKFFTDIKAAVVGLSISGKTITYTKADGTTGTLTTQDTTYNNFTQATASAAGTHGLVPAPTAENYNNRATMFLRSDGGWQFLPLQNNATTTAEHYALDARMGKTLYDEIGSRMVNAANTSAVTCLIYRRVRGLSFTNGLAYFNIGSYIPSGYQASEVAFVSCVDSLSAWIKSAYVNTEVNNLTVHAQDGNGAFTGVIDIHMLCFCIKV